MRILFLFLLLLKGGYALPFSLYQKETNTSEQPTLMVIGGIHGNEPGGYFSAAFLAQYYTITKGNLWIVPNLNRDSIMLNDRGIHGDMNRKFADIDPKDPDYEAVTEIKKLMLHPQVSLILNLHDGHGFYRKEYQNTIFNPNAWGQTCIIDQGMLDNDHQFGQLDDIASKISHQLNGGLIEDHHTFDVRNTNTRFEDEAMKHSLTYFAVTHNKPAFAIETSKNLPTLHHKVFYQLRAIECYMNMMGIEFKRSFDLNAETVQKLLTENGNITINNNFYLELENLKTSLSLIPLQSKSNDFKFSHPLGSVQKNSQSYSLYIGNQKIASVLPSYHKKGLCSDHISILSDGKEKNVPFATDFFVTADFKVINNDKHSRVNIIGYSQNGVIDESNRQISLKDLDPKHSVDRSLKSFRIEFYRKDDFCGMILVHFK